MYVCLCLTSWFHQCQGLKLASQQDVVQVSVAAVESNVPHIPHHDVLHTNIIFPESRKKESIWEGRDLSSGHEKLRKLREEEERCIH